MGGCEGRVQAFPVLDMRRVLVRGDSARAHAIAHVGHVRGLQEALHGAVLAEGAVQRGYDSIDPPRAPISWHW